MKMSIEAKIHKFESKVADYDNMLRLMSENDAFNAMFVRAFRNNAAKKLGNLRGIRAGA